MLHFLLEAGAAGGQAQPGGISTQILFFAVILAMMYFMIMRPEKKRKKEAQDMRSSMEVGDEVITAGGIVARIVTIKDDTLVIETTGDKTKLRILRSAIQVNNSFNERSKEMAQTAAKNAKEKKAKKSKVEPME